MTKQLFSVQNRENALSSLIHSKTFSPHNSLEASFKLSDFSWIRGMFSSKAAIIYAITGGCLPLADC